MSLKASQTGFTRGCVCACDLQQSPGEKYLSRGMEIKGVTVPHATAEPWRMAFC